MHFAARSPVGESMQQPLRYFIENSGFRLIDACVRARGAAVGVVLDRQPVRCRGQSQSTKTRLPIHQAPCGESKYMLEATLRWADRVRGIRGACLPDFNAAGADPAGRLGEDHRPETHLIPTDLADAHLAAQERLEVDSAVHNLGNGAGHSVLQVVRAWSAVAAVRCRCRWGRGAQAIRPCWLLLRNGFGATPAGGRG